MKFNLHLALILLVGSLCIHSFAQAEGERDQNSREENHGRARNVAPRPAPPKFMAHPAGVHPHGPMVRPHAVRVVQPRAIQYGHPVWTHWEHPEFARPAYYWDWTGIHTVSCTSEDSYGDQYPVTEATFSGFGLVNMTAIEDDALDRCYSESGGDPSCYLAACVHI